MEDVVGGDAANEAAIVADLQPIGVELDQHRAGNAEIQMLEVQILIFECIRDDRIELGQERGNLCGRPSG